jgi:transposase
MGDEDKAAEAVRLYISPEQPTTRQLAALLGVDVKRVRGWLREAGVTRPRGPQRVIDPDDTRTARKGRKQTWRQVASALGASETGAKKAYRSRYGDTGLIDRFTHLTGPQRVQLRTLRESIPPPPTGTGHHMESVEGRQLIALLRAHRDAGVRLTELGEAMGVSGSWAGQLAGPKTTADGGTGCSAGATCSLLIADDLALISR